MNVRDDLLQQAKAIHQARTLLRQNARKIGLRDAELTHLDRHLGRGADSLAIVAGSQHAEAMLSDEARPA